MIYGMLTLHTTYNIRHGGSVTMKYLNVRCIIRIIPAESRTHSRLSIAFKYTIFITDKWCTLYTLVIRYIFLHKNINGSIYRMN